MKTMSAAVALAATIACSATAGVQFTPLNGLFYTSSVVDLAPDASVHDLRNEIMFMPSSLEHITRAEEANVEARAETEFMSSWNGSRFRAQASMFVSTSSASPAEPFRQISAVTNIVTHAEFTLSETAEVHIWLSSAGTAGNNPHAETMIDFGDAFTGDPFVTFAGQPGGQVQWNQTFQPGTYSLAIYAALYTDAPDPSDLGASGFSGTSVDILFVPAPMTVIGLAPVLGLAALRRRRR